MPAFPPGDLNEYGQKKLTQALLTCLRAVTIIDNRRLQIR